MFCHGEGSAIPSLPPGNQKRHYFSVGHSMRGDWKGFLFPGAAREGGGQDSNKVNSRTPRGTKL